MRIRVLILQLSFVTPAVAIHNYLPNLGGVSNGLKTTHLTLQSV